MLIKEVKKMNQEYINKFQNENYLVTLNFVEKTNEYVVSSYVKGKKHLTSHKQYKKLNSATKKFEEFKELAQLTFEVVKINTTIIR